MQQFIGILLKSLNLQLPLGLLIIKLIIPLILRMVGLPLALLRLALTGHLLPPHIPLNQLPLELLLGISLHDLQCVVVDGLLLLDFVGVVDDHIVLHVEFAHV